MAFLMEYVRGGTLMAVHCVKCGKPNPKFKHACIKLENLESPDPGVQSKLTLFHEHRPRDGPNLWWFNLLPDTSEDSSK